MYRLIDATTLTSALTDVIKVINDKKDIIKGVFLRNFMFYDFLNIVIL